MSEAQGTHGKWKLIDPKISLGTILEIVALVFMVGTAYSQLSNNQSHIKELLGVQAVQIDALKKEYVRVDMQAIRDQRLDERLDEVKSSLVRIEALVK